MHNVFTDDEMEGAGPHLQVGRLACSQPREHGVSMKAQGRILSRLVMKLMRSRKLDARPVLLNAVNAVCALSPLWEPCKAQRVVTTLSTWVAASMVVAPRNPPAGYVVAASQGPEAARAQLSSRPRALRALVNLRLGE